MFLRRLPKRQFGLSGFADDLEVLEAADVLVEENRKATMKSVTQQEALENYEKNGYGAERNRQERPTRQKQTGKERNSGTAYGKKTNYFLLFQLSSFKKKKLLCTVLACKFWLLRHFPFKRTNSCTQLKTLI